VTKDARFGLDTCRVWQYRPATRLKFIIQRLPKASGVESNGLGAARAPLGPVEQGRSPRLGTRGPIGFRPIVGRSVPEISG